MELCAASLPDENQSKKCENEKVMGLLEVPLTLFTYGPRNCAEIVPVEGLNGWKP